MGARIPTCPWVGNRPIRKVATPISISVQISTFFRPIRSPSRPKKMPPSGRAM